MVDPRQGKRPFMASNEYDYSQGDGVHGVDDGSLVNFPVYSARSQHDMSVMVHALAQVIGNSSPSNTSAHLDNPSPNPTHVLHANQPQTIAFQRLEVPQGKTSIFLDYLIFDHY